MNRFGPLLRLLCRIDKDQLGALAVSCVLVAQWCDGTTKSHQLDNEWAASKGQ